MRKSGKPLFTLTSIALFVALCVITNILLQCSTNHGPQPQSPEIAIPGNTETTPQPEETGEIPEANDGPESSEPEPVLEASDGPELPESEQVLEERESPTWPYIYGHSVNKQPLIAHRSGTGTTYIYIIGAIHGNEPRSEDLVRSAMEKLETSTLGPEMKDKVSFIFIPVMNPDGLQDKRRTNENRVDLNRNFDTENFDFDSPRDRHYCGPRPASEPETRAFVKLIEQFEPALIYTIHQPYNIINYDGPAEEIASDMQKINKMKIKSYIGYKTPGSLGTYFGVERGIPVITLELPPSSSHQWKEILDTNVEAIIDSVQRWFARRVAEGEGKD